MLWDVVGRDQAGVLADRPRACVLVVEDDAATRMLLEDLPAPAGYAVRTAADGAAGLVALRGPGAPTRSCWP